MEPCGPTQLRAREAVSTFRNAFPHTHPRTHAPPKRALGADLWGRIEGRPKGSWLIPHGGPPRLSCGRESKARGGCASASGSVPLPLPFASGSGLRRTRRGRAPRPLGGLPRTPPPPPPPPPRRCISEGADGFWGLRPQFWAPTRPHGPLRKSLDFRSWRGVRSEELRMNFGLACLSWPGERACGCSI